MSLRQLQPQPAAQTQIKIVQRQKDVLTVTHCELYKLIDKNALTAIGGVVILALVRLFLPGSMLCKGDVRLKND